ncbi:hypothetical protein D3C72_2041260 [compost metagenome]
MVAFQPHGNLPRLDGIGKQEFDGIEARFPGGGKAVEEGQFGKHHAEVGSEVRHGGTQVRAMDTILAQIGNWWRA